MNETTTLGRARLGILFNFSGSWMGGVVYILNLIKILDFLDDKEKPLITVFYRKDLSDYVNQINYPYLEKVMWTFPSIYSGYIISFFSGRNIFIESITRHYQLDALYPVQDFPVRNRTGIKLISWYADLQHKYYPAFFSFRKILERNLRISFMLRNADCLVVSSKSVESDFTKYFRIPSSLKIHIFQFVSVVDEYETIDFPEIRMKYKLPKKYFIISNQFHKHKNHKVVLKALAIIDQSEFSCHIALTGKLPDDPHSEYLKELKEIITINHLEDRISFIGVIPRKEQLILMKNSQAVIQPSLFEGWSTVIEDAKSLQVPVIASSIPPNIEQLGSSGIFFDPDSPEKLAEILSDFNKGDLTILPHGDYTKRVYDAAQRLIRIILN